MAAMSMGESVVPIVADQVPSGTTIERNTTRPIAESRSVVDIYGRAPAPTSFTEISAIALSECAAAALPIPHCEMYNEHLSECFFVEDCENKESDGQHGQASSYPEFVGVVATPFFIDGDDNSGQLEIAILEDSGDRAWIDSLPSLVTTRRFENSEFMDPVTGQPRRVALLNKVFFLS